jgi:hypothetical protein
MKTFLKCFFYLSILTWIFIRDSSASDYKYYISATRNFATPANLTIADRFGNGYGVIATCGAKRGILNIGLKAGYRTYFDRHFYGVGRDWHSSRIGRLRLYNLNVRFGTDLFKKESHLIIFSGISTGIYHCQWQSSSSSMGEGISLSERTGTRTFWGFEFDIGFEIPIATNVSVRSEIDYSYLVTDIRTHYWYYKKFSDESVDERNSIREYKSINLGGKLFGIGAVYYFGG